MALRAASGEDILPRPATLEDNEVLARRGWTTVE